MKLPNPEVTLPTPTPEALLFAQPLRDKICAEIDKQGGKINFPTFMEMALYTPNLGYYTSGKPIFGAEGDFVTAPELSPFFSRCLARQAQEVLSKLEGNGDILEFGAGAGTMATDILRELETLNCLPNRYFISELSHSLRERQRAHIQSHAPHLLDRVCWIDELPHIFSGVIFGNEIIDALPTHRVCFNKNQQHEELFVSHANGQLGWVADSIEEPALTKAANEIYAKFGQAMPEHYETEININGNQWIQDLSQRLKEGVIFLIDYGFSDSELYRPERRNGSLTCHYKHCAHGDPLTHVGLQDITAHVDFTAIAEVAFDHGLSIAGYTTQTYFLMGCDLEDLLSELDVNDTKQFIAKTQPVKMLILPDEMGDLFKVIGLSKNFDHELKGFSVRNLLERL